MDFFTPAFVTNAFVPSTLAPHNPYFDFYPQQIGGSLLTIGILDVVLLRYTNDVTIWKILEVAVLLYDLALLWSNYEALKFQGRLSLGGLRVEDWGGIAITAQAAVVRVAFLMGVGLKGVGKGKGGKRV